MELQKYVYSAKVVKVYDGDTITIDIDLGFGIVMKNQKVRLYGINTPEIRGDEREQGLISRDYLRDKILDKEIIIQTVKDKTGKYGRWLGIIYIDNININELLITEGYAEEYLK